MKTLIATYSGDINFNGSVSAGVPHQVNYDFVGYFTPVENPPVTNIVQAGRAIPLKWESKDAAGNYILNLATVVSIQYTQVACTASDPAVVIDLVNADDTGQSELRLTSTGYHFNWKTEKGFANKCYELRTKLNDESIHKAKFQFKK
jgi:hypothetical protein